MASEAKFAPNYLCGDTECVNRTSSLRSTPNSSRGRPRRRIPIILTLLLSMGFGAVMTLIAAVEIDPPFHPIVLVGLLAEGLSHTVAAALLLEAQLVVDTILSVKEARTSCRDTAERSSKSPAAFGRPERRIYFLDIQTSLGLGR